MSNTPLQTKTDSNVSRNQLKRRLKARHLTMIAIGGTIGTGLFLASGATISDAGPGGALVAYIISGIMVYFLMTSLGEMASVIPVAGSFSTYGTKFVDKAFGFSQGWNYWYYSAMIVALELSAAGLIMKFWLPSVPSIFWSSLFLVLLFLLNILSVRGYGEAEYWFSIIKVATIIIFLVTGFLMILGIMGGEAVGFKNFTMGEAPFKGGFMAIIGVFMIVGFSFQGTEIVGISAGESENPAKNVPKAVKQIFWRILLFFILSIIVISFLIPYDDPRLLNADSVSVSPFTLVFKRAGLAFAASVMNAVVLTAVLSTANSSIYACSRLLWTMAKEGTAPRFLRKVNSRGVPINALYVTTIVGMLAFLTSIFGDGTVYFWLLNACSLTGFIAWLGIAVSHYRFRRAYVAQGKDLKELPYKAKWFPLGPILAFVLCMVAILGQNYQAFLGNEIDWGNIIASYIGLPLFLLLWFGYKIIKKTRVVRLEDCTFEQEDH
ncbi:lysine:proton symporter (AAT family) [Scopulibacillus darangshiensis]|uniref:Lysine:proton symporter (AAT family) n=1 Tax=Scopulibacillus darangshiensis TaxID=442528 RepID=A0A4R2NIG8_9BACL|nr:amino acid permease [Scopulibacillus darangshiensis]TCP21170.1 lysine:proton symporter (AAT family) [Scopulibacillus darangshiensis]